ncbi:hypothetical protein ZWY2020_010746 [Hordeum vulgare]|nr:hypothetical protein ZWY2020_010746 [Hordeum vulgare]
MEKEVGELEPTPPVRSVGTMKDLRPTTSPAMDPTGNRPTNSSSTPCRFWSGYCTFNPSDANLIYAYLCAMIACEPLPDPVARFLHSADPAALGPAGA